MSSIFRTWATNRVLEDVLKVPLVGKINRIIQSVLKVPRMGKNNRIIEGVLKVPCVVKKTIVLYRVSSKFRTWATNPIIEDVLIVPYVGGT